MNKRHTDPIPSALCSTCALPTDYIRRGDRRSPVDTRYATTISSAVATCGVRPDCGQYSRPDGVVTGDLPVSGSWVVTGDLPVSGSGFVTGDLPVALIRMYERVADTLNRTRRESEWRVVFNI